MPNVILPNLGIELPEVGSDQDTWGDILNADLEILDNAVQYDVISKTLSNVDVTLTDAEAASAVIDLSGTLLANVNVIVPATPVRLYLVRNRTSGAFTVTVKTAAGTGTSVQQGTSSLVYSDGTNIIQGATSVNGSFAVSGALSAGSLTVTGATTLNGNVTLGDAAGDAITVTGTATFAQAAQFPDGTAALPAITNTGDTNAGIYFPAADTVAIATSGLERLQVDPAGNAGLGVTPSAWASLAGGAFQNAGNGAIYSLGTDQVQFTQNTFYNGLDRYIQTRPATKYIQTNGAHLFLTAPSGTAGNPITFTQAMTLTQGGNLLVGRSVEPSAAGARLALSSAADISIQLTKEGANSSRIKQVTGALVFGIDGADGDTECARITSAGYSKFSNTGVYQNAAASVHEFNSSQNDNGLIANCTVSGFTSTAIASFVPNTSTAGSFNHFAGVTQGVTVYRVLANGTVQNSTGLYQTISDRRVKDQIQPLTNSGAFIDALQPKTWTWSPESQRTGTGQGFIADEFQQVCPNSVTGQPNAVDEEGNPVYQAIDPSTSEMIANLVAEVQSLRRRIAALEAR